MSLINKLIKQAKEPDGLVGMIMLYIMNLAHDKKTKWGLNKLAIKKDSKILDIGCGGGNIISLLSNVISEGKIYGIDYSLECVKTTKKNNQRHVESGVVEVKEASVSNIPYLDESFDFVTAVQTHYFWPDFKNDLKEVYRTLKKNGSFMIVAELYKTNYHMDKYKTIKELKLLFKEVNFSNIRVFENNGWFSMVGDK